MEERIGNNWWPVGWKVPAAFQHVFYFVAPPPRIAVEKGQFDVVRELKEGYYNQKPSSKEDGGQSPRASDHIAGLEDHFQWMMHSTQGKAREEVRQLYHRFSEVQNRMKGTELANALGNIQRELMAIEQDEISRQGDSKSDGYDSGSGSGSGSE